MRNKKMFFSFVVLFGILCMCSCAANPTQNVVTSKNDGAFDTNLIQPAAPEKSIEVDVVLNESFFSSDGSVEFTPNISKKIIQASNPVVEVKPHYFTSEDAQRIGAVLFPTSTFYEAQPALGDLNAILTRSEIQASIQRWLPYIGKDTLLELYPNFSGQEELVSLYCERIKSDIALYTELLETVPAKAEHIPAQWTFKSEWEYLYSQDEIAKGGFTKDETNDQICVVTTNNNTPYILNISTRNKADYKLNTIFAYPYTVYSPMGIDRDIFISKLCRTQKPTDEQINNVKTKAQEILDSLDIGVWLVDQCYLQENSSQEYVVCVKAVPVFEGISAMRREQISNLTSKQTYAANYYLSDVEFQFSPNGALIFFQLSSPVDVVDVINSNASTLDAEKLISKAKTYLTLSDKNEYGIGGELLAMAEESAGEEFICKINLNDLDYGLIRVKVANKDDNYYYVPGMILYGSVDYYGKTSGLLYESSGETIWNKRIIPLVALNAIDGTIISITN